MIDILADVPKNSTLKLVYFRMMNLQMTQFLRDMQKDSNWNVKLSQNALSIISILGGMDNVITLCLTHPDKDEAYCNQVLLSINQMVADIEIVSGDDDTQSHQKTLIDDLILAQHPRINKTKITSTSPKARPPALTSSPHVMVQNPKEYLNSCIIMNPDTCNNLYFKWLSRDKANWIVNVVTNEWYCIGSTILSLSFYFFSYWAKIVYGPQSMLFTMLRIMCTILGTILGALLVLTMNLDIIELIQNSFDFWFKMWNLIIWEVCFIWININHMRSVTELITTVLLTFMLHLCIFLIDAVPVKYNIKRKLLVILACILSGLIIMVYFTYQNVYFDPFKSYNFEFTNISIKDSFLGSYCNISLFVAKPLINDTCRWFQIMRLRCSAKCNGKNNDVKNTNTVGRDIERFVSLYKRSKVKW